MEFGKNNADTLVPPFCRENTTNRFFAGNVPVDQATFVQVPYYGGLLSPHVASSVFPFY